MSTSLLQELQIETRRALSTDALIKVLDSKLNPSETEVIITADVIIFLLGKALAKIINTRQAKDWT